MDDMTTKKRDLIITRVMHQLQKVRLKVRNSWTPGFLTI
jgi:hypothetical protein